MHKTTPIVNFSLRKEIFFVVIGSFVGAFTMHLPRVLLDLFGEASYTTTLLVMARVVDSYEPRIGFLLHIFVATIVGIATGIFLHKIIKFNLSKVSRGISYGIIAGIVVFVVFAIPVSQFLLNPNMAEILTMKNPQITEQQINQQLNSSIQSQIIDLFFMHIIWGITLGAIASLFTRKIGADYLCHKCNIEFNKMSTWEHHQEHVHDKPSDDMKKILILGGGYSGIEVLNKIQEKFQDDVNVSISLVSESNFFLHTPMLPEMATGTIEPRHIATPIREFCKRASFYHAKVSKIDLDSKKVKIKTIGNKEKELTYDYLVLALGAKTNFFGNKNIEENAFTIKSLDDAIRIRNHVISVLEEADQETDSKKRDSLVTFVVVGGGFSGVETVGELNEFVREIATKYYRNIPQSSIKVILVAAHDEILPEIGSLGNYAKEALRKAGVTIYTNTKLEDVKDNAAILSNKKTIHSDTIIWAGGIKVDDIIKDINTEHHKSGKVIVGKQLRLNSHAEVFALGDCAYIEDPRTGKPYPPTAQHAIREAETVAENLIHKVKGIGFQADFMYDTKGTMAKIGKKDGVALIGGHELRGFLAWLVWKQYYLTALPTMEKRIRVGLDWFIDLFFPRDITRLTSISDKL